MFTLEESALLGRLLRFVGWSLMCLIMVGTLLLVPPSWKVNIAAGFHSLEMEINTLAHAGAHHLRRHHG